MEEVINGPLILMTIALMCPFFWWEIYSSSHFLIPGTIDRYLGEGVLAQLSAAFSSTTSTTSTSTQRLAGHSLSQPTTKPYILRHAWDFHALLPLPPFAVWVTFLFETQTLQLYLVLPSSLEQAKMLLQPEELTRILQHVNPKVKEHVVQYQFKVFCAGCWLKH